MILTDNSLYQADCLSLMERMTSEQIALVYLDPPQYIEKHVSVPRAPDGKERSDSDEERRLSDYVLFMSKVLHQSHRVLLPTGSMLLHVYPNTSGYIRVIMDQIFGRRNFRGGIALPRQRKMQNLRPRLDHSSLLFYSNTDEYTYVPPTRPLNKAEIQARYSVSDGRGPFTLTDVTAPSLRAETRYEWHGMMPPAGRSWKYTKEQMEQLEAEGRLYMSPATILPREKRYLNKDARVDAGNVWEDLPARPRASERTAVVAQQPLELLERIVIMASTPGEYVMDPCCGSGTTLVAAQMHGRRWIGCEVQADNYAVALERLGRVCTNTEFETGTQEDIESHYAIIHRSYPVLETGLGTNRKLKFLLNHPVSIEETRHYEFKEVKGGNPTASIKDVADQYVVAFLNSEGGRIFWGIRDADRVAVGVRLKYADRDDIRRVVTERLNGIQPAIAPTAYRLEFHEVEDERGMIADLYIVEITVPRVSTRELYYTSKSEAWVKTDGGKKKLNGPEITQEVLRRANA